ncbi:hypothetical protein ABFS82_10G115500 [Erythranthe guttata]|uniref:Serine-rich protein-like protein n=1 Tax=Erythranthe guttata TaxID=4155 RepID=A0A022QFG6_ERYGU|nr:PREDICTED: uncharacterized protein LOC105971528 [Erythranthe guttata]EYU25275.1 hypothetical protein MIMGU_mgv1a014625mg [Erythranthe guttata]|eukprot:XP_012851835.1 PREDICTED: uncharacterized protein LOC105971528 [Erythranthe guttata]
MAALAARRSSGPVIRSISPSSSFNRHYSATHQSTPSHSSSAAASLQRPASPALYNYSSPSLRFSMDRPGSPNRSISFTTRSGKPAAAPQKRTCMCSPTNHPGSFRCSLHKANKPTASRTASCGSSSRLNMRRSAMKNSLVRIGTVEGDLVTRALAALIRPSSHNQRRRGEFRPRPSRLSAMAKS